MSQCVDVHIYVMPAKSKGVRSSEAVVIGGCETPDLGAEHQLKCLYTLSHLSRHKKLSFLHI